MYGLSVRVLIESIVANWKCVQIDGVKDVKDMRGIRRWEAWHDYALDMDV